VQITIALLARCVTTTQACLHLGELGRRSELIVCVCTLYEHTVTLAGFLVVTTPSVACCCGSGTATSRTFASTTTSSVWAASRASSPAGAQVAQAALRLGGARTPALADRAILADREWAERLGLDPTHRDAASLRRVYSIIFRVASAVAHPTLAGLQFVTERRPDRVTIGVEPAGRVHEAMLPVPVLIGTALAVTAQALGKPSIRRMNAYFEWLTDTGAE
jgi:hypothetical protein